jgi:beta-lysine 5,6-aminomutase beta subunit
MGENMNMNNGAEKDSFCSKIDLTRLQPYGDTLGDGKVQLSFTLPIKDDDKGIAAAKHLAYAMGMRDVTVAFHTALDSGFTFYIIYGDVTHTIDYTQLKADSVESVQMSMEEVDAFISEKIKRKIVVVGASTGTDAHTVGIDAILNRKGFAGHYGLERYDMFETHNLGSQITNEEFVYTAKNLRADVLLVSQTVTQKDVHVINLTELVELLEAENLRENVILICGGARITNELAKELGYDAGFGSGKFANDVAAFVAHEMHHRMNG